MANRVAKLITPAMLHNARSRRILWVDGRREAGVFEREALHSLGFAVIVAETTDEAVAAVERERFDVVVADLFRPTDLRAGFTLLSRLRNYNIKVPFIVYCQDATPEQQADAWKRGALGVVSRPSDLVALVLETVASAENAA
jgi:DNA-binding NtrC family response regulator